MNHNQDAKAWNTFWERQDRAGKSGGGCLPEGWRGIAERQQRVWHSFARSLPQKAKVLDLATGDGAVLTNLQTARGDLHLTGIDRATALPKAPKGITLQGGIGMEDLPFADNSFDAITSQFGFEYGDISAIAAEMARVLVGGGRVGFLTHRIGGPIVAHNRKRREQIRWAIEERDLPAKARASLSLRASGNSAIPHEIATAPQAGAAAHGEGSAAWEIAEAIRQALDLGRRDSVANVEALIADIEAQAENELGRIASLERAAGVASDEDAFYEILEKAGFAAGSTAMVTDGRDASPFADYRTFTLKS